MVFLIHSVESFPLPDLKIFHNKIQYIFMNAEGMRMILSFRDNKTRPFSKILERLGDDGLKSS